MVDCHTHVGEPQHFSGAFVEDAKRAWGEGLRLGRSLEEHWQEAVEPVDAAIVLAFAAPYAGFTVPNEYVAEYVSAHPEKLVGFASVDPADGDARHELIRAHGDGLRGLKLAPTYQDVDPLSPETLAVCETAGELGLPILWHMGTTFIRKAPLKYAQPLLIDEIALRFPDIPMIIAHLGHPWMDDTLVVIRKHPSVYADVSALSSRPWQLYRGLLAAHEYRVMHKLLFGTDYPFDTTKSMLQALRTINRFAGASGGLPSIPSTELEGIITRDTLSILGLTVRTPTQELPL